jgi:hypothetical protein
MASAPAVIIGGITDSSTGVWALSPRSRRNGVSSGLILSDPKSLTESESHPSQKPTAR